MTGSPPGADLLTSAAADELLEAALATGGRRLRDWGLRSVHRRGRSLSVLYDVTTGDGAEELLVGHVSEREVPAGAVELSVGDARIHLWRYPADPYLPGLPSAVSAARVGELLDGLGLPAGQVRLRVRSYRPTRRAVVEVTVTGQGGSATLLFLKVLGGRTADRVAERTRALALPHRQLRAAGLPVPGVVGVAEAQGIVALTAVAGRTLRSILVDDAVQVPSPEPLIELSRRISEVPLETTAAPRSFASAERHVPQLLDAVPDLADLVQEIAAAADAAGGPTGTVHGDLHDGQLLYTDGAVSGLLDVDGAGTGLVAHDAGRLIAYVDSLREREDVGAARGARFARDLFVAYRDLVGEEHLRRSVAGARLSMATGPARTPQGDWREDTRRRIREAAAWLG